MGNVILDITNVNIDNASNFDGSEERNEIQPAIEEEEIQPATEEEEKTAQDQRLTTLQEKFDKVKNQASQTEAWTEYLMGCFKKLNEEETSTSSGVKAPMRPGVKRGRVGAEDIANKSRLVRNKKRKRGPCSTCLKFGITTRDHISTNQNCPNRTTAVVIKEKRTKD
jgi:molecular chaperone DnaK (HSP70)